MCLVCYTRKSWLTDKMIPTLSGINTLSKEKSVFFMLYKAVVVDEDDACFVRDQHAM